MRDTIDLKSIAWTMEPGTLQGALLGMCVGLVGAGCACRESHVRRDGFHTDGSVMLYS